MKGRTLVAAAVAVLALAGAAHADEGCAGVRAANAAKLTVQVGGVRPATGEVAVTVYPDDRRRFLAKGGKLLRRRVKAQGVTQACFWLPPATYAVAVYHDRDGDRDFDRTAVGLPAEGFGFSNNPETKFGLPPLASVRFRLPAGERILSVQMRYLR